LCSILIPFSLKKINYKWVKWSPAGLFLCVTLFFGLKALILPAPEMAVLGEVIYFIMFGVATIGSTLGVFLSPSFSKNNGKQKRTQSSVPFEFIIFLLSPFD
jgi:hypothetical protein